MTAATLARPTTRDWRHDAACAGMDTEDFFPPGSKTWPNQVQIRFALDVCGRCPVQAACLAWAMRLDRHDRRLQVVGGRWMDSRGRPHVTPTLAGIDHDDEEPTDG